MVTWLTIFAVFWGAWKLVPKHLSSLTGDVLKLEWIRELQARSAERNKEGFSPEEIQSKFSRRVGVLSVGLGVLMMLLLAFLPISIRAILATIGSVGFAVIAFRITRHRRHVVIPLYLTLCRIPGSRWDATRSPSLYLRIPKKSGKPLTVRLPMDWHAGPMQLREVESIVRSRVPGNWKVDVDAPRFLMKFHPVTTSVVDVGPESISTLGISADLLSKEQDDVHDIEELGGPW